MDKKQCNYCGSKNLIISELYDGRLNPIKKYRHVTCMTCKACGPLADDDNEAIIKWNNRIQEAPEIPQEDNNIFYDECSIYYCPIIKDRCKGIDCMMWISVSRNDGRCGLVNTQYINSTVCGA